MAKVSKRVYGWKPDIPDQRDISIPQCTEFQKSCRRKPICGPCARVEDQGNLGSCTAHALTGALEVLERKNGLPVVEMSRLFVYYNERVMEGSVDSDDGAMLRDGIKTLVKEGACMEEKWPYIISRFKKKPPAACYKDGLKHQVTDYQRIDTVDQMRACLADGFPFVFGFAVYESFETQAVAKTGKAVDAQANRADAWRACGFSGRLQ